MYTVSISFENKNGERSKEYKTLDFQHRKEILEKAFTAYYGRTVKIYSKNKNY